GQTHQQPYQGGTEMSADERYGDGQRRQRKKQIYKVRAHHGQRKDELWDGHAPDCRAVPDHAEQTLRGRERKETPKKDPADHVDLVLVIETREQAGKHHREDDDLDNRIQQGPEKPQNRPLVAHFKVTHYQQSDQLTMTGKTA